MSVTLICGMDRMEQQHLKEAKKHGMELMSSPERGEPNRFAIDTH